jgi:hypothetical protein
MRVRASDNRLLGKVSIAWRSCSLRGIRFVCFYGGLISIVSDRPIQQRKNRLIAFSLAMAVIAFANAPRLAGRSLIRKKPLL